MITLRCDCIIVELGIAPTLVRCAVHEAAEDTLKACKAALRSLDQGFPVAASLILSDAIERSNG